jgi:hypothetical protein
VAFELEAYLLLANALFVITNSAAIERARRALEAEPRDHRVLGLQPSTPGIRGHVYDVVFDPVAGTATWTDISYDLGDQPILDSAFDSTTGDTYVSPDFGVNRL